MAQSGFDSPAGASDTGGAAAAKQSSAIVAVGTFWQGRILHSDSTVRIQYAYSESLSDCIGRPA